MRAQYGESVLGVYDYFSSAFGPTNIGNGGARPISYYSDYWIDGFAQVDAEDTFWEERLLTDTDLSELGTDGIIISSYMFDCIRYYKLYENAPYRKEYELNDYNDVVGKPLKFNARDGTNVTLTIRGVFRADLPAEYEPLKDYSLNTYNPEMRALASRLDVEMEYGIYNLALVSDRTANIRSVLRGTDSPMTHSTNTSVPMPSSNGALRTLLRGEETVNADDSFYMVRSVVSNELDAVESVMEILELAFLLAGILMAVFAMLLLYNFISVSISYKKKEIGILRAVGARGADVFKIFYCESAIIALVCYVLALIGCFVLCAVLNSIIMESVSITLLVFGPLSWLVMLVIAVFTSALATFLPVRNYTKRKPIESIRTI